MEIPPTLKIGGHLFTIQLKELEATNGETSWKENTITIDQTLPQSHKEATLLHEIIHVLNTTIDSNPFGHAFMDSLSEQIYQVLADNYEIEDLKAKRR